jgi:hypothetical protein
LASTINYHNIQKIVTPEMTRLLLSKGAWKRFFSNREFYDFYDLFLNSYYTLDKAVAELIARHDHVIKFLKKKARSWVEAIRASYKIGKIIVKNEDKLDLLLQIRYRDGHDTFWEIAFSGRFKDPEGEMTLNCDEAGLSRRAVILACMFKNEPKVTEPKILEFIGAADTTEKLEKRMRDIVSLGEQWEMPLLVELPSLFLEKYIQETIKSGGGALERLRRFLEMNPLLASYIWTHNFGTAQEREHLAIVLQIPQKCCGGFKKAETPEKLLEYVRFKEKLQGQGDLGLPPELQARITRTQEDLQQAKKRLMLSGVITWERFVSVNEVDAINTRLRSLLSEADRYITKTKLEEAKKKIRLGVA